jgi:hypothetical protein
MLVVMQVASVVQVEVVRADVEENGTTSIIDVKMVGKLHATITWFMNVIMFSGVDVARRNVFMLDVDTLSNANLNLVLNHAIVLNPKLVVAT